MFEKLKDTQKKSEQLNAESQEVIDRLEEDNKMLNEQVAELKRLNIEKTEERDKALDAYEEMKNAVLKLDESRFLMNKLMGPNGALT